MLDEAKSPRGLRARGSAAASQSLAGPDRGHCAPGADSLLDAYRVVKRSFLEATGALAQVEARAAAGTRGARERSARRRRVPDELLDETGTHLEGEGTPVAGDVAEPGGGREDGKAPPVAVPIRATPPTAAWPTSIHCSPVSAPDRPKPRWSRSSSCRRARRARAGGGLRSRTRRNRSPARRAKPIRVGSHAARRTPLGARESDDVLAPVARFGCGAKRTAQDDQGALLGALRRHKGRPSAAQVLVPEPDLPEADLLSARGSAWSVMRSTNRVRRRSSPAANGGDALELLADEQLVSVRPQVPIDRAAPTRTRLAARRSTPARRRRHRVVWSRRAGRRPLPGVEEPVARGRSWATLAAAWARGVYDASPDGRRAAVGPAGRGPVRRLRRQRAWSRP